MRDGSAFSLIWVIFIIIGIIMRSSAAKKRKEQQSQARRSPAARPGAARPNAAKAPDFGEAMARNFARQAAVPSAPSAPAAAAPAAPAPEEIPDIGPEPIPVPEADGVFKAREDFGSITGGFQGEGAYAQGSMEYVGTEGEDDEEHSEHLRSAEEARRRDAPVKKKTRFDQKQVRSAFIASEILGRPVSMR